MTPRHPGPEAALVRGATSERFRMSRLALPGLQEVTPVILALTVAAAWSGLAPVGTTDPIPHCDSRTERRSEACRGYARNFVIGPNGRRRLLIGPDGVMYLLHKDRCSLEGGLRLPLRPVTPAPIPPPGA